MIYRPIPHSGNGSYAGNLMAQAGISMQCQAGAEYMVTQKCCRANELTKIDVFFFTGLCGTILEASEF